MLAEQILQQDPIAARPTRAQGIDERRAMAADMMDQRRQDGVGSGAGGQPVQDDAAVQAKDLREHATDATTDPIQRLVDAMADRGPQLDEPPSVAARDAEFAKGAGRHHAGLGQRPNWQTRASQMLSATSCSRNQLLNAVRPSGKALNSRVMTSAGAAPS